MEKHDIAKNWTDFKQLCPVTQAALWRPLLEIVESCHQEKLLKEEFWVQHSYMSCTANQSVGSVGQSMKHIMSDQSAALSFHKRAQEVVDHFCIHWPWKEGRQKKKLEQNLAVESREQLCICVGRAHNKMSSKLMLVGANNWGMESDFSLEIAIGRVIMPFFRWHSDLVSEATAQVRGIPRGMLSLCKWLRGRRLKQVSPEIQFLLQNTREAVSICKSVMKVGTS